MIPRIFDQPHYSAWYAKSGRGATQTTYQGHEISITFACFDIGAAMYGAYIYSTKTGSHSIRVKLYAPGSGNTTLRNETFVLSDATKNEYGVHVVTWSAGPHIVTVADLTSFAITTAGRWHLSLYDPDNASHTYSSNLGMMDGNGMMAFPGWFSVNDQGVYRTSAAAEGRPTVALGSPCHEPRILAAESNYEPTPRIGLYSGTRAGVTIGATDYTVGGRFRLAQRCRIWGVRFYTHQVGPHTYKCSIWSPGNVQRATVTSGAIGQGYHDVLFGTPLEPSDTDLRSISDGSCWKVGVYQTTNGSHTTNDNATDNPGWDQNWGVGCYHFRIGEGPQAYRSTSGDAIPTTVYTSQGAAIDPLVTPDAWGI